MRTYKLRKCSFCGKEFESHSHGGRGYQQKYCSKKCKYADAYIIKNCPTCSKEFRVNRFSKRKDYCSKSCIQREPCQFCGKIIIGRNKYQSGERHYCSRKCASIVNRTLKSHKNYWVLGYAACLKRHGTIKCERCNFTDGNALIIHHLDHNRENLSPENLIVLCANCHHLEHWSNGDSRKKYTQIARLIASHTP